MTAGAATSGGGDDAGVVVMSLRRCPWRAGIRVGSDQLASYAADGEAGCVADEEPSRAVVAYPPGSGLTFPRQSGEPAEKTVGAEAAPLLPQLQELASLKVRRSDLT
jgi:hypothetical protein